MKKGRCPFGFPSESYLGGREEEERLRLSDLIIPLLVGSPFQGEHREAQTPAPCTYYVSAEFRLAVESYVYDELYHRPFKQTGRAVLHKA